MDLATGGLGAVSMTAWGPGSLRVNIGETQVTEKLLAAARDKQDDVWEPHMPRTCACPRGRRHAAAPVQRGGRGEDGEERDVAAGVARAGPAVGEKRTGDQRLGGRRGGFVVRQTAPADRCANAALWGLPSQRASADPRMRAVENAVSLAPSTPGGRRRRPPKPPRAATATTGQRIQTTSCILPFPDSASLSPEPR